MKPFLILISFVSILFSMSGREHLSLWNQVSELPFAQGGLGGELTSSDRKLLQNFIDFRYDHSSINKRNLPSHNANFMANTLRDHWNPRAVKNAVALHAIGDMYNTHVAGKEIKVGVNGYTYTKRRGREAERIINAVRDGRPVQYPSWAIQPGPSFNRDRTVVNTIKNQAQEIGQHIRFSRMLNAVPLIFYSAELGKLVYTYGTDAEIGEEEAVRFLTQFVAGEIIFQGTVSIIALGSGTLVSLGTAGTVISIVLPIAATVIGAELVDQFLTDNDIRSFNDLGAILTEIPELVDDEYRKNSRESQRRIRELNRNWRRTKRKLSRSNTNWDDRVESIVEFSEESGENIFDFMEDLGDTIADSWDDSVDLFDDISDDTMKMWDSIEESTLEKLEAVGEWFNDIYQN